MIAIDLDVSVVMIPPGASWDIHACNLSDLVRSRCQLSPIGMSGKSAANLGKKMVLDIELGARNFLESVFIPEAQTVPS